MDSRGCCGQGPQCILVHVGTEEFTASELHLPSSLIGHQVLFPRQRATVKDKGCKHLKT